uniref:Uncharacterized protein n=1 Tax=Neogobius melanostomus TaxID=47308 RepID=A0A8C6SCY1_9GOBI
MSRSMSGPPLQRRQINIGSQLLTPQDNESLFNHLGRKCIVSFIHGNRIAPEQNC